MLITKLRQIGGWTAVVLCVMTPLFVLAQAWLFPAKPKVFRIGYAHFPPLMVKSPAGPGGFAVEVVKEAARRKDIRLQWVPLDGAPETALRYDKIDLYPMFASTPVRRQTVHITQPWWDSTLALIVDRRSGLTSPDQMDGRKIAFVDPSISTEIARQRFPRSQYVRKFPYQDVLASACSGEADAAFMVIGLFVEMLEEGVPECAGVPLTTLLVPDALISYSVASSPQSAAAAEEIASQIGVLTYDGTLAKIGLRTGVPVSNQAQLMRSLSAARRNRNLLVILAAILALIAGIVSWQNRRVRQARRAADRARKAEAEFLAHMSHEIRTPMNGVLGMLGLALETNPNPEMAEYLETANHSALALMSVLNDILDFSKIDAGRLELESIEFSPAEVLEQSVKTLSPESSRKGLSVIREIAPDVPKKCVGDPNRLRQILLNLIGNAIKFTDRGSITVKIKTGRLGTADVALTFEVRDTGIGIPRSKQETIFQAFSQADRSTTRKFGGTGLGLAIVSRLVELMNGRIWVHSEPDHGSTFHFTVVLKRTTVLELAAIHSSRS